MIRYRMDYPTPHPVPVECIERGYPHLDADRKQQFANTHFDSEEECWTKLLREAHAAISLDSSSVRRARAALAESEKALVESALALDAINKARAAATAKEQP